MAAHPMPRSVGILLLAFLFILPLRASANTMLPIHIAESHGGTFYFLAGELKNNASCTLLLFDAHDDATAIFGSDAIRKTLRSSESDGMRSSVFDEWRRRGVVQSFNWLEPLMPDRIARVIWVAGERIAPRRLAALMKSGRDQLDLFEEIEPRSCGVLESRLRVTDLAAMKDDPWLKRGAGGIIVSIDLDFFAETPDERLAEVFQAVWKNVMTLPDLRAVSFAVSTPWHRDPARAERLACMALEAAGSVANAGIRFEPFEDLGPDRSTRAKKLVASGSCAFKLDLKTASPGLRTVLLSMRGRFRTRNHSERLEELMNAWAAEPFLPEIVPVGRTIDPDGRLHVRLDQEIRFHLKNRGGGTVRWFAMVPGAARFNVFGDGYGFAEQAGRYVFRVRREIGKGPSIAGEALIPVLDPVTRTGTVLLFAEVERDGDTWRSKAIEIAVRGIGMSGFRGALSEVFARPYVFGAALLKKGPRDGPDLALGADCSTFLIDGLRRNGRLMNWTDAEGLYRQLEPVAEWPDFRVPRAIPISAEEIEAGFFVFLGRHIAAVWEDRQPIGVVGREDVLVHQLEGYPELISLNTLMNKKKWLKLARLRKGDGDIRLAFGGDVMLGRRVGGKIASAGFDPFSDISGHLRKTDLAFVTLESLPTTIGSPSENVRYVFRAPASAPELLARAGIDGVSLAHNHAQDFGNTGLVEGMRQLNIAGIRSIGVNQGEVKAASFCRKGVRFSLFGYADFPFGGGICDDLESLLNALRIEQGRSFPIVLVHWGEEHNPAVTNRQRVSAERMIAAGAKLIIGSGPHLPQEVCIQNDVPVAWSLGNLVFDGPGPDADWSRGMLLDVRISRTGRCVSAIPRCVSISPDGKPSFRE